MDSALRQIAQFPNRIAENARSGRVLMGPLRRRRSQHGIILVRLKLFATGAQDGFLDLAASLRPPMFRNAPVISPMAKNEKYMRAAGSRTTSVTKGGRLKSTGARLC